MKQGTGKLAQENANSSITNQIHPASIPMISHAKETVLEDKDLIIELLKFLNANELARMSQVNSKMLNASQDSNLWNFTLSNEEVPTYWQPALTAKERCKSFFKECDYISETYPPAMIQALVSVKKIAALPVIDKNNIQFNQTELFFSGVGRGLSRNGLCYIGLAVKIEGKEEPRTITLFAKCNSFNASAMIMSCIVPIPSRVNKNFIYMLSENLDKRETIAYINRLVNREPCGAVVKYVETEPKTNAEGNSLVALLDAQEYATIKAKAPRL